MILRRIIAHLRDQQWTAIALDFVIVVTGVFVGIQASNYNAERVERRMEAEYADRIVADLDLILKTAREQREFEQEKTRQVGKAMAQTALPTSDRKSLELGNLLTVMIIRLSPNYESPTFTDLQNSGRMALIRDVELRKKLSVYFSRLQYLRGAMGRNNDNYVETYVDFLRAEAIGAGYADPASVGELKMVPLEKAISSIFIERFGTRDVDAHSAQLGYAPSDIFWPRMRSALSWRGIGAAANENIVNLIIKDAEVIRGEVERERNPS